MAQASTVSPARTELQQLFTAYQLIKAQYVENVDDKKAADRRD
jgi:hypothetical protein